MRYKTYIGYLAVIAVVFLVFLLGTFSVITAQQPQESQLGRVITFTIIGTQGTAQILPKAEVEKQGREAQILGAAAPEAWKPAMSKTTLNPGDQLQTGSGSSMKLGLDDGGVIELSEETLVVVEELRSARGDAPKTMKLRLAKGKIMTRQAAKLLGQTDQAICTDNGCVYTRLGEVEISQPEQAEQRTIIAALPMQEPGKPNVTHVTLHRGTSEIESFGTGVMTTRSLLLPETCFSEDGIQFTLKSKSKVTVSKLEAENEFRLSSKEKFQLLAATGGTANKVTVSTLASGAVIDIEGVDVAELKPESRTNVVLNELLTVGITTSEMIVRLACDESESRGINDFGIQGVLGEVAVLRTGFGPGTERPDPSRGVVPGVPLGPTPTPTPEEPGRRPTPTPTPTPGLPPQPGPIPPPIPGPITFDDPSLGILEIQNIQVLSCHSQLNGSVSCGQGNCGINQSCVNVSFEWVYPPDMIEGAGLYIYDEGTPPGPPTCANLLYARYIVSLYAGDPVQVSHNGAGTITFSFCSPGGVLCDGSYNYSVRVGEHDQGDASPCTYETQFTVGP